MSGGFKHEMGATVTTTESKESGRVIARSEFDFSESSYLVRYVDAQGIQRETWFQESAIADLSGNVVGG